MTWLDTIDAAPPAEPPPTIVGVRRRRRSVTFAGAPIVTWLDTLTTGPAGPAGPAGSAGAAGADGSSATALTTDPGFGVNFLGLGILHSLYLDRPRSCFFIGQRIAVESVGEFVIEGFPIGEPTVVSARCVMEYGGTLVSDPIVSALLVAPAGHVSSKLSHLELLAGPVSNDLETWKVVGGAAFEPKDYARAGATQCNAWIEAWLIAPPFTLAQLEFFDLETGDSFPPLETGSTTGAHVVMDFGTINLDGPYERFGVRLKVDAEGSGPAVCLWARITFAPLNTPAPTGTP